MTTTRHATHIYLATVGQRPQAITIALDKLLERQVAIRSIVLLHTDPVRSGIATALQLLITEIEVTYPALPLTLNTIHDHAGQPLLDIESDSSAEAYYWGVIDALLAAKQCQHTVHLMIAGGRKAMGIYAVFAASLLLDEFDSVWMINTPPDIMQREQFHLEPVDLATVQLMKLPFLPARFAPTTLETLTRADVVDYVGKRKNRKQMFLSKLTKSQQRIVNVLAEHDEYTDQQIALLLVNSVKTIENHFTEIYRTLRDTFDFGERIHDPRLAVIKIMKGWE